MAPPQVQAPPVQASPEAKPLAVVQLWQLAPPVPHWLVLVDDESTQVLASAQQPLHEVVVQVQLPPTHASPTGQGIPMVPQEHWPPWQESARIASHAAWQAAPPEAHPVEGEVALHVWPTQQPAQLVAHGGGVRSTVVRSKVVRSTVERSTGGERSGGWERSFAVERSAPPRSAPVARSGGAP